jgi:glycosyltransferase involved in cell wall biosynthesis
MKIAIFHNLPSGGAKRIVFEQVKHLSRSHEVDLYSLKSADHKFCEPSDLARNVYIFDFEPLPLFGSPLGRLNQAMRILDIFRLRRIERAIAAEINRQGYDVALVHPCQFTVSPAILHFLTIPTVYYSQDVNRFLHDPQVYRPYLRRNRFHQLLDQSDPLVKLYYILLDREHRANLRAADRVLTNSYFTRESLYRVYGVAPFVSYHGIDVGLFRPLNLDRKRQVLSVGAICPKKGYEFIIESLGLIPEQRRPTFIVVGNAQIPEERRYLEQLAIERGVQLHFQTLVADDELLRLYNESIVTVYTPVMESFGLVPLESMACETPVAGVREGGVRETVIHGVTGLLSDRDPGKFAEAVTTMTEDQALARRLGQQGREYVIQQWTWDQAINTLNAHLEEVAELHKNGKND